MYIHYYLDSSLKVVKITGNISTLEAPPKLPLGYSIHDASEDLSTEIVRLIKKSTIYSAEFSNDTPIYNLGFFEQTINDNQAYYKLLQLTGANEQGIVYLLEYSTLPDVFTLDLVDHEVIENIEISRFKDIIKVSSIGVLQVDEQWRTLYASKAWSDMTGYSLTEIAGRDWAQIIYHEDKNRFLETLHQHAKIEKNAEQDIRIMTANGGPKWYNVHYRVSYDSSNDCTSIILIFLDIHSKRQSQDHLREIATTDVLTRLSNRYAFQEELEKYIRQLHPNQPFNLLFIDLDGFKPINDAYGHLVGDKLLAETARRISSVVGFNGFVARLGGDEFAILRPESSSPDIEQFAVNLLQQIAKPYSLVEDAQESYISASIGIVGVRPNDISYMETLISEKVVKIGTRLLREADAAMYYAKEVGKNTYRFYAGSINEEAIKTQILSDALHRALEHHEFRLHYQPQWNINSSELYGYESLIRWSQGTQDVSPGLFIPLVESNGLMGELGRWIFEKALSDHSKLLKQFSFIPQLSVNFSPIQFRDHKLCAFIEKSLGKFNIPTHSVTIEITESLLIEDHIQVKKQLETLKELGLKIALDDFGTGYSSLSNLHTFPIDIIKVDQSFTKNLAQRDTRQIVRAIIKMSNELNKTILFEGVETEQQLTFLQNEGVDLIQGWLISKAIPVDRLTHFIEEKEAVCP
jgi:diguanylate cyclase (GGDEF)-like protein/PAS domain S-box-containing protein